MSWDFHSLEYLYSSYTHTTATSSIEVLEKLGFGLAVAVIRGVGLIGIGLILAAGTEDVNAIQESEAAIAEGETIAENFIESGQTSGVTLPLKNGAESERYTTMVMDAIKKQEGKIPLPYYCTTLSNNNNGLDRVYANAKLQVDVLEMKIKFDEKNFDPDLIEEVLANLNQTENLGRQGSLEYVINQASKLINSGASTDAMVQTGKTIALSSEINRYLVITVPSGRTFVYHLNFWEMAHPEWGIP